MKKLNVGCGIKVFEGWDNLDMHDKNGANIIFNLDVVLNGGKFPIKDNEYDEVLCSHVLEDFPDPTPVMDDMIRILKPGGKLIIKVPNETCVWMSIYHKRGFASDAFYRYVESSNYNYNNRGIKVSYIKYNPLLGHSLIGGIFYNIAKLYYKIIPNILLKNTFMKYIFPNCEIEVCYKKGF